MLVLSRQRDETIMIGDEIEITVVDIRGDKVRLGIAAPARIAVHRKEVYESIRRENEQAARIIGQDLVPLNPGEANVSPGPARLRIRAAAAVTPLAAIAGSANPAPNTAPQPKARAPDGRPLRKAG